MTLTEVYFNRQLFSLGYSPVLDYVLLSIFSHYLHHTVSVQRSLLWLTPDMVLNIHIFRSDPRQISHTVPPNSA